ncbi:MAG: transporter substrate-binding domain-containing protein, partial [Actinobacteria bacterium]|nr:transporter substrate-binding domain-containing protein [Actinomycetota bacterium]NIW30460.1 transporter substrate-binding domain-containing protein [Actinomycetota bacterium]NIX22859.1 transporter substrate-binding domain-containing protein [Actinomycetota bacterium]
MAKRYTMDRRAYLRTVGGAGLAAGLAGCLGGGGGTPTSTETEITAGTAPGFPPFEIKEDGELKGFDIDLMEAVVAEAEGYTLGGWKEF